MRSRASLSKPSPTTEEADTRRPARDELPPAVMEPRGSIDQLTDKVDQDEERRDESRRQGQARAPKAVGDLSLGRHARVVDHLFEVDDPMEVYERIRAGLSFGGRASSLGHGELIDALDEAQKLASEASRLAANMKVTVDSYLLDADVIQGSLRKRAREELQDQKAAGKFAGNITIEAISDAAATMFADEYRDLSNRINKAKRSKEAIEFLAERAVDRARDLRAMVSSSRAT